MGGRCGLASFSIPKRITAYGYDNPRMGRALRTMPGCLHLKHDLAKHVAAFQQAVGFLHFVQGQRRADHSL